MAVPELFVNARGESMPTKGRTYLLDRYTETARQRCASLREKQISPHALHHACAMMMLQATGDLRKVSLWLGHVQMQTAEIYLRMDPTKELDAIEKVTPMSLNRGCFTAPDRRSAAL